MDGINYNNAIDTKTSWQTIFNFCLLLLSVPDN